MDSNCKILLQNIGIQFNELIELENMMIPREQFLSEEKYNQVKSYIPEFTHFLI
jgi:hypothetical protein